MSLLGTGCSRIRVAMAGGVLLTLAAVALGLGSTWIASGASDNSILPAFRPAEKPQVRANFGHAPLVFEANQGQSDSQVKFLARGAGYGLFLTSDQAVLELHQSRKNASRRSVIAMKLAGARSEIKVTGNEELPGKSNYFIGKDYTKWHRNVPQFARVRYAGVYPGIDLVYYGKQGQLEYDFEVAPGSDPRQVRLRFQGTDRLSLDAAGNLVLTNGDGDIRFEAPRVYQQVGTEQRPVAGRFVLRGTNEVAFAIADYDRSRKLVIDPVLSYSSYLGGSATEGCFAVNGASSSGCPAIAVDAAFNIYVAGTTTSTDFPLTPPPVPPATGPLPYQAANAGGADVFVTKFDITGSVIQFSTYLGGTGKDTTAGIAVDNAGNVFVTGNTTSNTDFPTTANNAAQAGPMSAGNHAFASELTADGSALTYSTYLGGTGTDTATGLALDFHGKMYVTGTTNSSDFPVTATALQSTPRAANQFFITKLDPTALDPVASLAYSTYFGGATPTGGTVTGGGIAIDTASKVYITGGTTFTDMGLNSSQAQAGANDAIVAKFDLTAPSTTQEIYSTYVGGTGDDIGHGIAVDTSLSAYITGSTTSNDVTTITRDPVYSTAIVPFQAANAGGLDAFVAKIGSAAPTGSTNFPLNYFSYLGGTGTDIGLGIAVDTSQGARITGSTTSGDFHLLNNSGVQSGFGGGVDAFIARIDTTATSNTAAGHFSTYMGGGASDQGTGIAVDTAGNTYVAGETASGNFPLKNAFQGALSGGSDAFVSKLGPTVNLGLTVTATPTPTVGVGNQVTFKFVVTNSGDLASGVTFTDSLPTSNATFVSASTTVGNCGGASGGTVVCNLGTMNSSATATVTIILTPTAGPGTLSNSATVTVPPSSFTKSASTSVVVNDFTIAANPLTQTVQAGVPANYTLTLTPTGPIPNSISLSCSSGLPSGGSCTFTTATIPNLNNGTATSTVHVNTTVRPKTSAGVHSRSGSVYAALIPVFGFALFGYGVTGKRRRLACGVILAGFLGLMLFQAGCGSSSSTPPVTGGTPAGTYSITLSGTSSGVSRTTTVTLVVQ